MKYWVYKDSRIMGPYDREAFAGLPGVDASTLVSVGDSGAGEGDWKLAGEIPDLAGLALDRPSWAVLGDGDAPAVQGMLDRLQIDAAGLVGDEDFPAGAEDLFQDAAMKKGFADLLAPRSGADEAELRRAKERAEELAYQVEALHKRLNELESSRAELMHRLAEQEARGSAPQAPLLPPAPAAAPVVPPPIAAAPVVPPPIAAVPSTPALPPASVPPPAPSPEAAAPGLPAIPALPQAAPAVAPSTEPGWGAPVGVPGLPSIPAGGGPPPLPSPPADAAPAAEAPPAPAAPRITFNRRDFKVVPTRKSFRVVGADEAAAPPAPAPTAAAPSLPEIPPAPAAAPVSLAPPAPAPAPPPEPAPLPSLAPPPPLAPEAAPAPAPVPVPEPAVSLAPPATMTFAQPFSAPPVPTPEAAPAPAPAATPAPSFDDLAGSAPPVTMQVSGGASEAAAPVDAASPSADAVLARLAKPSAPPTAPPVPRPRSYKAFYVAGALLVVLLAGIGYMFRTPKAVSDLTTLDDGRPGVGAEDASAPVAAPPPMPEPAPAPPPAAPEAAAPQADTRTALDAAVELVKGFPLDGDRGTVGAWLQYSYAASADAGREVWSASAKGDDLFLVEYRVEPAPGSSSPGVFYLFEADMARRFILAKNPEARQMLAGAPPPVETKPAAPKKRSKPRAAPKPKPRPRPEPEEPKEVPLLPLPGEGELRPPAEDDGAFGADTVGGGI